MRKSINKTKDTLERRKIVNPIVFTTLESADQIVFLTDFRVKPTTGRPTNYSTGDQV